MNSIQLPNIIITLADPQNIDWKFVPVKIITLLAVSVNSGIPV